MSNLTTIDLKAFVPSRDFEFSKRFYTDLGFTVQWSDTDLACLQRGDTAFLLQNYYVKEFAASKTLKPWAVRDFMLIDPTGVLWRIAQPQS